MRTALVVAAIVIAGALVILGTVLPATRNAKLEGIAIGEEAGKVMWRVGAFYAANGRFPASARELGLPGAATRDYRLYDSEATSRIELVYSVSGGEVTIQNHSGKTIFAPVLERGALARWQVKESTYSEVALRPLEFGALFAVRCLDEVSKQPMPECARFRPAREALRPVVGRSAP
jgi:hypothetical protein